MIQYLASSSSLRQFLGFGCGCGLGFGSAEDLFIVIVIGDGGVLVLSASVAMIYHRVASAAAAATIVDSAAIPFEWAAQISWMRAHINRAQPKIVLCSGRSRKHARSA